MSWIKNALLDLIILALVIVFAYSGSEILEVIIWVYTGILFIGRILYFFMGFLKSKTDKTNVPSWFYHLNYFITIFLFIYIQNYYLAGAWVLIWIMSAIAGFKKDS